MPRCFACIHCGKCGPPESDAKSNPPGYCIFCDRQNAADAKRCSSCGKLLPRPAGLLVGDDAKDDAAGGCVNGFLSEAAC